MNLLLCGIVIDVADEEFRAHNRAEEAPRQFGFLGDVAPGHHLEE